MSNTDMNTKTGMESLSEYERRQAIRLLGMRAALIDAGLSKEDATNRILMDLRRGGSVIPQRFIREVLV